MWPATSCSYFAVIGLGSWPVTGINFAQAGRLISADRFYVLG
jgi:hypothetical protein